VTLCELFQSNFQLEVEVLEEKVKPVELLMAETAAAWELLELRRLVKQNWAAMKS